MPERSLIKRIAVVTSAFLVILPALALLRLIRLAESYYPLRLWLVRRGWYGYYSPQETAIRECPDCQYIGVLAVDKHRAAPMSKTNWELRCPECNSTIRGPICDEEAGAYMSYCHPSEWTPPIKYGGYAAFKSVEHHNSRVALSLPKIRRLERARDRARSGATGFVDS